ncbi:ABC transporter permease subunit [Metarhizobium album]|uniref:ABC transporter permease subunit n=1 Tax=Metarhizobium album TaxID=2182425 RepID=UPI00197E85FB|nr:hypothetical protein [Rhizobium album]
MIDMLLSQVLDLMMPVLLAAMAGALCERAGVFNIALEGKMLVGAFVAVAASIAFGSPVLAVLAAVVCTAIFALPLALGGARFGGDPIVIGIGLNLLASGLTTYLLSALRRHRHAGRSGCHRPAALRPCSACRYSRARRDPRRP